MAAVFLGERVGADFEQQVAIKLLRRGLYSELEQRLFQRERQVLATLDHPNIARLIDGGVTDAGIPYLVMEHVDGVPITTYAHDARARSCAPSGIVPHRVPSGRSRASQPDRASRHQAVEHSGQQPMAW